MRMGEINKLAEKTNAQIIPADATSIEEFEAGIKTESFELIVFDWTTYQGPSHVAEIYFQSKHCRVPMVIWTNKPGTRDKAFFQEFDIKEFVDVREPKVVVAYNDLLSLMSEMTKPTSQQNKVRVAMVRLNYYLNNGKLDLATNLLEKARLALTSQQQCYFDAKILLAQGNLDQAVTRIANHPKKNVQLLDLLGSLLFQKDDFTRALTCFTNAHGNSPLNLRRGWLISKCQAALSETKPELRLASMTTLLGLNKICPTYPGVNGKIVQMIIASEDVSKIPIVKLLLKKLDSTEIMRIYKMIGTFNEPFLTAFSEAFVTAMSTIANTMIAADDLTALKYYKYIGRLVPEGDRRWVSINYCTARAYFRFGQLDMAEEFNNKAIKDSGNQNDKAITLARLIEGAKKGQFDVLLDNEEDWLISKKVS